MRPLFRLKDRFSKERFSVGLDIGTSTVKLVKLKFSKEVVEICDFNIEPLQFDQAAVLKKIVHPHPNIKKINISVSGHSAIIRYVNFPKMEVDELMRSLRYEAQKHIPFSIDEVNLDSYILNPDLPDNKMFVLLAAVKKEFINQRLKLIGDAGLNANIVDIDSLALINAFNFNYSNEDSLKNKTIALLNIGALLSNLSVLDNGIPRLSRDIHIAGNNFTQKLADTLGIDFKSAQELKHNPDKEKLDKMLTVVESVLSTLAGEVRISFDYYESQNASTVAKIFLSGAGSKLLGLKDMLANLLGIEVEYWDPLRQINIPNDIDSEKLKEVSSQLAVAVGLALRS